MWGLDTHRGDTSLICPSAFVMPWVSWGFLPPKTYLRIFGVSVSTLDARHSPLIIWKNKESLLSPNYRQHKNGHEYLSLFDGGKIFTSWKNPFIVLFVLTKWLFVKIWVLYFHSYTPCPFQSYNKNQLLTATHTKKMECDNVHNQGMTLYIFRDALTRSKRREVRATDRWLQLRGQIFLGVLSVHPFGWGWLNTQMRDRHISHFN